MFIGQWQLAFQNAVESLIKSVFQTLELQISSNTFVIGIHIDDKYIKRTRSEFNPTQKFTPEDFSFQLTPEQIEQEAEPNYLSKIFLQPGNCGFEPKDFGSVFAIAENNFLNDPEHSFFHFAANSNQAHKESLYPKAVRNALRSILRSYDLDRKQISFCSFPVQQNEYWITTVIQLDRLDFDHQYRLIKEIHETRTMRKQRIDRCFLEAIIYRILKESELELQRPSDGKNFILADSERVIEDGAYQLLQSIEVHINQWNKFDLFSFANTIAAERYEGEGSKGRLIICAIDHPDILVEVKLKVPIKILNHRGIRKLLEISGAEMALLCDVETVWGLGTTLNTYQSNLENLFEIRFAEHYTWELVHAENIMLHVKYRRPRLPKERFDRELFYDYVDRFFKVDQKTVELLSEAVAAAVEQRHGTMLIITPEAEAETNRLKAESTAIEKIIVSEKIISHVSSVDGAILISPDGYIHSFGVILDGESSKNGNSARGARFNSAIRYIDGKNNRNINCLALIVSEDGYVDLYPTLRRRIPRVWIDRLLDELEQYANPQSFKSDKAWSTLIKLDKLSFYLLESDVERANKIKDTIVRLKNYHRAKAIVADATYILAQFEDFQLHSEMNLEYYLPQKIT